MGKNGCLLFIQSVFYFDRTVYVGSEEKSELCPNFSVCFMFYMLLYEEIVLESLKSQQGICFKERYT